MASERIGRFAAVFTILAFIFALQMTGTAAFDALRYQRAAIFAGEAWRLVTSHFVHVGWQHTLLNAGGLLILALGFPCSGGDRPYRFIGDLLLLTLGISTCLLLFSTTISWYVGLSGVLHGLLVIAVLEEWKQQRLLSLCVLGTLAFKLAWEQIIGPSATTSTMIGAPIVVDAHLFGALVGLGLMFLRNLRAGSCS